MRIKGTSHESHQWKIFDDIITNFNQYCKECFSPYNLICSDDSISRWYGQGGHWVNMCLPMYVATEKNLENGDDIRNAACRRLGITMWIRIVNSARNEADK